MIPSPGRADQRRIADRRLRPLQESELDQPPHLLIGDRSADREPSADLLDRDRSQPRHPANDLALAAQLLALSSLCLSSTHHSLVPLTAEKSGSPCSNFFPRPHRHQLFFLAGSDHPNSPPWWGRVVRPGEGPCALLDAGGGGNRDPGFGPELGPT